MRIGESSVSGVSGSDSSQFINSVSPAPLSSPIPPRTSTLTSFSDQYKGEMALVKGRETRGKGKVRGARNPVASVPEPEVPPGRGSPFPGTDFRRGGGRRGGRKGKLPPSRGSAENRWKPSRAATGEPPLLVKAIRVVIDRSLPHP